MTFLKQYYSDNFIKTAVMQQQMHHRCFHFHNKKQQISRLEPQTTISSAFSGYPNGWLSPMN